MPVWHAHPARQPSQHGLPEPALLVAGALVEYVRLGVEAVERLSNGYHGLHPVPPHCAARPGIWSRFGAVAPRSKPAPGRSEAGSALPLSERSEEHTSELQSLRHLVCRLLLEKKKKKHTKTNMNASS